jgi:hypothetical protein
MKDPELRRKTGREARKTIIEKYSVNSQKENYLRYFSQLLKENKK